MVFWPQMKYNIASSLFSAFIWHIYMKILENTVSKRFFDTSTPAKNFVFAVSRYNHAKILRNIVSWTHNILFLYLGTLYWLSKISFSYVSFVSIGYYLFDLWLILYKDPKNLTNSIFILHHIIAYLMFAVLPTNPTKYITIISMAEISNIFLYPSYHYLKVFDNFYKNRTRLLIEPDYQRHIDLLYYRAHAFGTINNLKLLNAFWYSIFRVGWNLYFFMNTTLDHSIDYMIVFLMFISFVWSYHIIKNTFSSSKTR